MTLHVASDRARGALSWLEEEARHGKPCAEAELDELLRGLIDESDGDLSAVAELFGLDMEALEERAAIIQFDAGKPRVTANRLAATQALQELVSELSDASAKWLIQNAAALLEYQKERGLTTAELMGELRGYIDRQAEQTRRAG